ncbi:MAG: DJ-1/PfpI family protein [Candidatus Bathyarchaeia archaeon]
MKKFKVLSVFLILFLSIGFQQIVVAKETPKVLLFITDGSPELEFMLIKEVGVMKTILEHSGFEVDMATVSGESISIGSVNLDNVLKLANVNTDDYSGFILPCMGVKERRDVPEMRAIVEKAVETGKPVAAQLGSVRYLAGAGVLKGKKYSYRLGVDLNMAPEFEGGIYNGTGIVQDGNIITSGVCPLWSREKELKDGTS